MSPSSERSIKLTADIATSRSRIRLNVFYCPRNTTVRMATADVLASKAVKSQKPFKRIVQYSSSGQQSTKTHNESERRVESEVMSEIALHFKDLGRQYPMPLNPISTGPSAGTRRRKMGGGWIIREEFIVSAAEDSQSPVKKQRRHLDSEANNKNMPMMIKNETILSPSSAIQVSRALDETILLKRAANQQSPNQQHVGQKHW